MSQVGMLWLMIVLVVAGGALTWYFGKRADAKRVSRFRERASLETDQFWRDFYPGREVTLESVVEALRLVSDTTEVQPGKLRPTDRFTVELAPERGWEFDDGLAEIAWYVESKSKGSSEGLETVDDLIRLLDRLEHQAGEREPARAT